MNIHVQSSVTPASIFCSVAYHDHVGADWVNYVLSGATCWLRCRCTDINIDGISDGDAEGNDKTGADGKDGEDEFLDERTMELMKLHFFADRYSVNSHQLHV